MKLDTNVFGNHLRELGYNFYSGVPCSFLKYLINYAINSNQYVMASNEGDAVAMAAGAYLGGSKSVVLMQNSGLTNAVSPLTSLNYPFKIPVLGFVSLRGEPGLVDEPQHELVGEITPDLLTAMKIQWDYLSTDQEEAKQQLTLANWYIENEISYFFIVRKDTFELVALQEDLSNSHRSNVSNGSQTGVEIDYPRRFEVLQTISKGIQPDTVVLATTGKTGRELFEAEDRSSNLYMVGSMGCVSSLGLGLALAQPRKKIVVIDGDGSLLMRMGSMPTIAYYQPNNLLHLLLDNNSHDSTGGQATVSAKVDFISLATSLCYDRTVQVDSMAELESCLDQWEQTPTLTFLYMKIAKGSKQNLGRPSSKPAYVKNRLMDSIQ